jgi:hypothetical protein
MARWKFATARAAALRRWNVSRRRTVAEAQPQCRMVDPGCEVCDPGDWGGRRRQLTLDRYRVWRD